MNITKIHLLRFVAALSFCAFAVSCMDNEPVLGRGEPLPPGKYPLKFVASVDGMTSRAETHDSWSDGDEIGIRIGDYPKIGRYMLNADGTVMSGVEALDWQTIAPTTVTAWYPYVGLNEAKTVETDDQSKGFVAYDFLTAVAENQIYTNTVKMNFKHQMSKIACKLVKGQGISDEEFNTVKVSIAGFTKASFSNGVLTGSYKDGDENNKWITPFYDNKIYDYEALVVPQDMTGKEFIKIDLKVNHNGTVIDKTLIYNPDEGIADLKAGTRYYYSITVKKDRLEVHYSTTSWEDEGEWHPAQPAVFRVIMPKVPGQDLIFSNNVFEIHEGEKKEDNYILVSGNRFSISFVVNDDNITKALNICGDSSRDVMIRDIDEYEEGKYKYVFNYYVLNEVVELEYVDYLQVGDYYYEDGTWGPSLFKDEKKPIGVIFRIGAGGDDDKDNYNKDEDWEIHGYAVALKDAVTDKIKWGLNKTAVEAFGSYDPVKFAIPYSGYYHTMRIKEWGEKGNAYDAVQKALEYQPKAPDKSSGWYLPSIDQLVDIQDLPDRASLFTSVDGEDVKPGTTQEKYKYWSCLERSAANAYCLEFDTGAKISGTSKNSLAALVRAVLTF